MSFPSNLGPKDPDKQIQASPASSSTPPDAGKFKKLKPNEIPIPPSQSKSSQRKYITQNDLDTALETDSQDVTSAQLAETKEKVKSKGPINPRSDLVKNLVQNPAYSELARVAIIAKVYKDESFEIRDEPFSANLTNAQKELFEVSGKKLNLFLGKTSPTTKAEFGVTQVQLAEIEKLSETQKLPDTERIKNRSNFLTKKLSELQLQYENIDKTTVEGLKKAEAVSMKQLFIRRLCAAKPDFNQEVLFNDIKDLMARIEKDNEQKNQMGIKIILGKTTLKMPPYPKNVSEEQKDIYKKAEEILNPFLNTTSVDEKLELTNLARLIQKVSSQKEKQNYLIEIVKDWDSQFEKADKSTLKGLEEAEHIAKKELFLHRLLVGDTQSDQPTNDKWLAHYLNRFQNVKNQIKDLKPQIVDQSIKQKRQIALESIEHPKALESLPLDKKKIIDTQLDHALQPGNIEIANLNKKMKELTKTLEDLDLEIRIKEKDAKKEKLQPDQSESPVKQVLESLTKFRDEVKKEMKEGLEKKPLLIEAQTPHIKQIAAVYRKKAESLKDNPEEAKEFLKMELYVYDSVSKRENLNISNLRSMNSEVLKLLISPKPLNVAPPPSAKTNGSTACETSCG